MRSALILAMLLSGCQRPAWASSGKTVTTAAAISTLGWNLLNIEQSVHQTVKVYRRGRKIAAAAGRGMKSVARTAVGK